MIDSPAACFIVSTGRCGSTLLGEMLGLHPGLLNLSEFFTVLGGGRLFEQGELRGADLWRQLDRPFAEFGALVRLGQRVAEIEGPRARLGLPAAAPTMPALLLVTLAQAFERPESTYAALADAVRQRGRAGVAQHFDFVLTWLAAAASKLHVVERSGASLLYLDRLIAGWPRARFVHLVRDGHDTALSMARHPYFRILSARLLTRDEELPVERCLSMAIPLHRYGALWSVMTMRGVSALADLDAQRVMSLRYEDLVSRPAYELARTAEFIGIRADAQWLERAAQRVRTSRPQPDAFSAQQREQLDRRCLPGQRLIARFAANHGKRPSDGSPTLGDPSPVLGDGSPELG